MKLVRKTTFITLLLGTTIVGSAQANSNPATGCSTAKQPAESEGVGWQPAPGQGVQRTEAQNGGGTPADTAKQPAESEGVGRQPAPGQGVQRAEANQSTKLAAADPCQ